jgi:ribose transport system substrate-binding protein
MVSRRGLCAGAVALGLVAGSAALSLSSSASGSPSTPRGGTAYATAAKKSCIPAAPSALPNDPDGVAAKLTGAARAAMIGYPGTVYASPWAHFEPKGKPPWKIGFSINAAGLYDSALLAGVQQVAKENPSKFSSVISVTPSTPNDVTEQIQQMRSLLDQHVSIIFAILTSPTAVNAVIDQATQEGVPVITLGGASTDKNAINLQPNPTDMGYYGAAGLVTAMGSTPGNVLVVQGIAGLTNNTVVLSAGERVLKACSEKIIGTLSGFYDPATAETAVLTFLPSFPGTINGVFQAAGMTPGIITAFQKVGRTVPPIADVNPGAASLVYWEQHEKTYHGSAVATVPLRSGEFAGDLGLALLEGRGVKITDVPFKTPVVTASNLSQWVEPGWTSASTNQANGPASSLPITALVNGYTTKP